MENPLNIGLIGCGQIARQVHLPTLNALPGIRVVAAADTDAERLPVGIPGFTDYRQLLARPDLQAVIIATANATHAEIAGAAFAAGKHVYLEKPIAPALAEAEQVLAAWQAAGTVGMIGFNYRFNPLYAGLRRELQAGQLGEIVAVRSVFTVAPRALPVWKQRRSTGGGVLLDLGSHHVDLVRFFFGREIVAATATVRSVRAEADTATLELRLESGLLVQSLFSWSAVEEDCFTVYGTKGKRVVNRYGGVGYRLRKRFAPGGELSYRAALGAFVAAVREQTPVTPDLTDGYRSLAALMEAESKNG